MQERSFLCAAHGIIPQLSRLHRSSGALFGFLMLLAVRSTVLLVRWINSFCVRLDTREAKARQVTMFPV